MNARASELSGQGLNVEHHFSLKMQSQKTTCLKCQERGNVLVCSNSVCPIVLHKSCMTSMPWFDNSGKFYCPYCFYQQALVEYHLTKEKALLSKRKLLSFLGSRTSRSNSAHQSNFECLKRKKPDASTIIEERNDASCTNVECNGVSGKEQAQELPKDVSLSQVREDNAIMIDEKPNGIYDKAYEDDGSAARPMTLDLGFANQSSGIRKPQSRMSEGQTNTNSQIKASNPTSVHNDTVIDKNPVNSIKEHEETSKAVGQCYGGRVEKEKTHELSQEDCVLLTSKDNAMEKLDGLGEKRDTAVEDKYFLSCEMVENSENADQPHESVKNSSVKALIDDIGLTTVDNVALTHELGDLKRSQEAKEPLEEYHDGVQNVEETQTELQSRQIDNKKVMAEESDGESYSSVHNECFVRNEMGKKDVELLDEGQCKRNNEEPKKLKLWKFVPPITVKGSASASHDELDIADDTASSNTNYLDHGFNSRQKEQLQNNSIKLSVYSETEVEESEVSVFGKSRHKVKSIKHIQQSIILPAERRRKLPWTVEEVEMLKAGVLRFSLKVNKNLSWLKILDFGRHVFDGTRTPPDLKDKWKNIKGK